jgi:uncharacterized protein YkwD
MKATKLFLCVLLTILLISPVRVFSQNIGHESHRDMEGQILKLINQHRKSIGLGELQFNDAINAEALKHSQNMANGVVPFSHDGFDGRASRIMSIVGGNAIAENVANGQEDAASAVESWLSSSGHRKNIEGNYTITGIGIARGKNGDLFFTQIFLLYQPTNK